MHREPVGQSFRVSLFSAVTSAMIFTVIWFVMLAVIASEGRPAAFLQSLTR